MQRLTRARTVLALALVGALALAGCGGGGDNGAEQDLRDQLAMLQTDLDAANAAKMTAEAAQAAAAEAQADAEAAQATAETDRDAANTAKGAAEQAATNAMAAQAAAEGAQTEAEAAQATAEAAQIAAQTAQATAETDRDAAKAAQMAADAAQATAEAAQVAAAAAQATAEAQRDAAMAAEMAAMETQATAEKAAMDAMAAQATAEAARAAAEAARDADAETLATATAERDAAKDAAADAMVAQAEAAAAQKTAEDARDGAIADKTAAEEAAVAAKMAADEMVTAADKAAMDAEAARMAAVEAQTAAETRATDAETAAMDAETARMAAETRATDAETAAMDAETARMAAETRATDAETAAMDAETARMAAVEAAKDANDKAEMYKAQLAEARGEVETGEVKDANAAAKALLAVLEDNDVANLNRSGLAAAPMDDPDTGDNTAEQTSRNNVANLMVEVSSDGMLMAEVEDDTAYSMSDMAPDPGMIGEVWRGAMLTRDNPNGTMDTVVVYSDIGNDGTKTLFDRYASNLPTVTSARSYPIAGRTNVAGVLINEVEDAAANSIRWDAVTRPDDMTAVGGTSTDPITMFMGSVHSIPGTFSCNAAAAGLCTAPERYSGGAVDGGTANLPTARATAWTFVPDEGVPTYTDDPTYLTFGWWLDKDAGGNPTDFLAFSTATGLGVIRDAEGEGEAAGGVVSTLAANAVGTQGSAIRGSATYKGAAAGKYATASTLSATYEGGHFTADATLKVDFDADLPETEVAQTEDRNGVTLSGTIDNFMTGSTSRPDWMVKLMADGSIPVPDGDETDTTRGLQPSASLVGFVDADITTTGNQTGLSTEWSTGGTAKGTGEWTAEWYGGVTAVGTDITAGSPAAVVGTFDANIGDVTRLQGAFGANKVME